MNPLDEGARILILAPGGRDSAVARSILKEAKLRSEICRSLDHLCEELDRGADIAVVTEEALRGVDLRPVNDWVISQPPWSDFPFIVLTQHGGGVERNPAAARTTSILGNVTFLERPFHPTTLISIVHSGLRGRSRQYECRRLNENLEGQVHERTSELAAANRQLLSQMKERERVESTLQQMQRLEAVGQLTAGVAHDFNNLLMVLLGNITLIEKTLADRGTNGKLAKRLGNMRAAAERGAKLTDQLLSFSRRQRLEPRILDLNEVVSGMRTLLESTMGGSIRIETELDDDLWSATVDATQLELAVLNLSINARDAMDVGGTLKVRTFNATLGPPESPEAPPKGDYAAVSVTDTGTGMPLHVRARVFEPFFTTKEFGKGSGLGLSQVLGFAQQSNGGLWIDSRRGQGTTVCLYLPRAKGRHAARLDATAAALASEGADSGKILLVDDDEDVREVTAAFLDERGYEVLQAGSGGAALDALERDPGIEALVIDFAMPGMNGAEVIRHVRASGRSPAMLLITGFVDRAELADTGDTQVVRKPFTPEELSYHVRVALAEKRGEA